MDHNLPITIGYWLIAILPLAALLIMLVGLKWSTPVSGGLSLVLALITAFIFYETPLDAALVGIGKGVWNAFFILLVVWTSLIFYQITLRAGAFAAIRKGIQNYSKNYLFLVLAFGWVFASFLQGVTGFGAPIAIVAPLLIGIGVKPVAAVVIPLIGHLWSNSFGTLGTVWIATTNIVALDNPALTALYTSLLLWIPNLISGLAICWIFARWKAVKEGFMLVAVISLIHGGGQTLLTQFNPVLSNFIATTVAMGAVLLFTKLDRYKDKTGLEEETTILQDKESESDSDQVKNRADLSFNQALVPYYFLTVISVVMLGIPFIAEFLGQFEFGFGFPEVETGYGYTVEGTEAYSPLSIFTHPGFYLLLGSLFAYFWFKRKKAYKDDSVKEMKDGFADEAVKPTLSIIAFLAMSQVLEHSGQNTVLALGIGAVAPPVIYAALTNWIGILGAFMTSSNTSSNILFAPLHAQVVSGMEGLTLSQVIAGQTTGGAIGNAIAPANIVLGTSTAGIEGKTSEVLKQTLIYTVITGVLVSLVSIFLYVFF